MADKDDEKRRDEEDDEDEALAGKAAKARDEAEAEHEDDEADEPKVASAAAKEVADAKVAAKVERAGTGRSPRLAQRRQAPKGSLAKSLMLFVIIVGGLIVAFALISREEPNAGVPSAPKWTVGQTVDLELTVVPTDAKDLSCASAEEIAGKKCQFEAPGKAYAPPPTDDKKILKPYTTTDRVQIIGAGLWSEPALEPSKLPNTRFSVKCKYKIDGKMKAPGIRWASDGPWYPQQNDWHAGTFSNCIVTPP